MSKSIRAVLIDSDTRRRAFICHLLSKSGIHTEPFDDVHEIGDHLAQVDLLLVHDEDNAVGESIEWADRAEGFPLVVAFAGAPSAAAIVQAIQRGAANYIEWPFFAEELHRVVLQGQSLDFASAGLRRRVARARDRICQLTKRERQVLDGMAQGLSNRKIGESLSISQRTVEIHRANLLHKIGANHTSDAIRLAIEATLIGSPSRSKERHLII